MNIFELPEKIINFLFFITIAGNSVKSTFNSKLNINKVTTKADLLLTVT